MLVWSAEPDGIRFGAGGAFQLESSRDEFGVRSHGVTERLAGGETRLYPLPQSDFETYAKLRPKDAALNPLSATANHYDRQEAIGPHQVEGGRLWFGNRFYDGEGDRGVGAFGYFDTAMRQYRLFSTAEVAPYEIRAMLVEPDCVWVALDHFGEDISRFPGELVRWDRKTQVAQRYSVEFVVTEIAREGESLRLTTGGGYALLTGVTLRRFRTQTIAGGRTATTPIDRFPPPPSRVTVSTVH